MYLFRVELPETPGTLGRVATAMGMAQANIHALEIVDRAPGKAVDDFIIDLPTDVLPDSVVSACQAIEGVKVLWVSRSHSDWTISSDIELLNLMTDNPERSGAILTEEAPNAFHSVWAVLVDRDHHVVASSEATPEFTAYAWDVIGDLDDVRTTELPEDWMPFYGETVVAIAPLSTPHTIIVGRKGGPAFLPSELTRLRHLAALADG